MANTLTDLIMIYALQGKAYYKEHKAYLEEAFKHAKTALSTHLKEDNPTNAWKTWAATLEKATQDFINKNRENR